MKKIYLIILLCLFLLVECGNKKNYEIIFDRKEAIKKGLDMLNDNDTLLILGKGHEDYQIIGHEKLHLSDKEEVLKYVDTMKK